MDDSTKSSEESNKKESLILDIEDLKDGMRCFRDAFAREDVDTQREALKIIDRYIDISAMASFYSGHGWLLTEDDPEIITEATKRVLNGILLLMDEATGGVRFGSLVGACLENIDTFLVKMDLPIATKPLHAGAFSPDTIYDQIKLCLNTHPNIPELQRLQLMLLTFRKIRCCA